MLTSIDEFNQLASAIEPIRLAEASSPLHQVLRCTTHSIPLPFVDFSQPLYLHDLSLI